MKKFSLLLTLLGCTHALLAQNLSESFSSPSALLNWHGQTSRFIINAASQLQLNDSLSGMSSVFKPLDFDTSTTLLWNIYVKQSFAGSENNQSRIYLCSSDSILDYSISNTSRNSYFLKLGEAGSSDVIRMFKESNGTTTELMAGITSIASSMNLYVQVERSINGQWSLRTSTGTSNSWTDESNCTDSSWNSLHYFGICCKYTSSNSTKFYFDDIAIGNPITEIAFPEPNNHSVVINEIYADPSPSYGLPNCEYIELFNTSNDTLNLGGCILVNSTTEKVLPSHVLLPQEYLILCNELSISNFSNALGIPSFTALTNSGDSLTLLTGSHELIDEVSYHLNWHTNDTASTGGIALERINPFFPCNHSANWASSTHPLGGTPNQINSVANYDLDTAYPVIESFLWTEDSLILQINEFIDSSQLTCLINATLFPSSYTFPNIILSSLHALSSDTTLNLFIENLTDCWGNSTDTTLVLTRTANAHVHDLVINEILADPDPPLQGPAAEFIELINTTNHTISLEGCTINDKPLLTTAVIPAHHFMLLGDSDHALAFLPYSNKILIPNFPSLTNGGMYLELNCNNELIDSVTYSINWYSNSNSSAGGVSLERVNPNQTCSSALNWKECQISSTPAQQNSVFNTLPDTLAPQLLLVENKNNNELILHFNKPIAANTYLVQIDSEITDTLYVTEASSKLTFNFPYVLDSAIHKLSVLDISDCEGNSNSTECSFGIIEFDSSPQLVINEILFNPHVGGYDFVELFNGTNQCQSLHGLKLSNSTNSELITTNYSFLLPHQFLAITENKQDILSYYPVATSKNLMAVTSLPTFNDDEETVMLFDSLGTSIDAFHYSKDMQFPLLKEVEGVSLERISPYRASNDSTNWHSASYASGFATPGCMNSQYHETPNSTVTFDMDLELFSPDNDGYQDLLTFQIRAENANEIINLKIFNYAGTEVARLLSNENCASVRTISWDGVSDHGEYLPVGIYLAVLEMFTPESASTFIKKDFVLAKKWQ